MAEQVIFQDGVEIGREIVPDAPRPTVAKIDFYNRFTDAEFVGIVAARKVNPVVDALMTKLDAVSEINLQSPVLVLGVNQLEEQGLLVAGRAAEILAV